MGKKERNGMNPELPTQISEANSIAGMGKFYIKFSE